MSTIVNLLAGFGLLAFGIALIFFPGGADDPYRHRKFAFAKGSASQVIFGGIALFMGTIQLIFWARAHF